MSVKLQDLRSVLLRYHHSVFSCLARLTEERRGRLQDSRYALELVRLSTFSFFSDAMKKYEVDLPIPLVALVNAFLFYNPDEAKLRCIACSRSHMLEEAIAMIRKSGTRFNPTVLHQDDCPLSELMANGMKQGSVSLIDDQIGGYLKRLLAELSESFEKRSNILEHSELDQFALRHVDICTYDSSKFAAYCEHLGTSEEVPKPTVVELRSCFRKQRYGRPASDVKETVMVSEQTRLETFEEKANVSSLLAALLVRAGMYLADNKLRCAFCRKTIKLDSIALQAAQDRAYLGAVLRQLAIVHCRLRARCPMVMNLLFDNVPFTQLQLAELVQKLRHEHPQNDDFVLLHSPPETASSNAKNKASFTSCRANTLPVMRDAYCSKAHSSSSSFTSSCVAVSLHDLTNPFGSLQTLDFTPCENDKIVSICKSPSSLQLAQVPVVTQSVLRDDGIVNFDLARFYLPSCTTEIGAQLDANDASDPMDQTDSHADLRFAPADFCAKLLHAYRAGPEFSSERVRLETFTSNAWDDKLRPSAKWMSLAGFYMANAAPIATSTKQASSQKVNKSRPNASRVSRYAFTVERRKSHMTADDATLCFSCGGLLSRWVANDDPFVRHAFNFPDCCFILICLGRKFVNDVQRLKKTNCNDSPVQFNAYSSLRGFWKHPDGETVSEKLIAMYADQPVYRYVVENLAVPRQYVSAVLEETLARGEEPPCKAFELLELVSYLKMRLAVHDISIDAYHSQVDCSQGRTKLPKALKTTEMLSISQLVDILKHEDNDDRGNAIRKTISQSEFNELLPTTTDPVRVSVENKEQDKVCASCRKLEVEFVLDCRHVVCEKCKKKLGKNCPLPICRQRIKKPKKINKN